MLKYGIFYLMEVWRFLFDMVSGKVWEVFMTGDFCLIMFFWFDMVSVKVWEVFMVGDEPTEEGGAGNRWEKLNQRWDGSERMDHC